MFRRLGWAVTRAPLPLLLLAIVSVVAAVSTVRLRLSFSTDRTQLLEPDNPVQQTWQAYRQELGRNTELFVMLRGQRGDCERAVEDLGQRLEGDREFFTSAFYKIEMPELEPHALYFLSVADLRRLLAQLQAARPVLGRTALGPDQLLRLRPTRAELEPALPLLASLLRGLVESLESRGRSRYQSPMPAFRPDSPMLAGKTIRPGVTAIYNTLGDNRTLVLMAQPRDRTGSFVADEATVARLRRHIGELQRSHPRVSCLVSGESVINTDEMVGARDDALRSGTLAIVLVTLLMVLGFGNLWRPACLVLALGVGLSWSFCFAALQVGTLNLLTVHFGTILVGLSMTFGIQFLCRYQELGETLERREALVEMLARSGPDCLVGAVTTAVAFWSLQFTSFRAAGELGLLTGTGVLLCFVSIVLFFPALLALTDRGRPRALVLPELAQLDEWLAERPGRVLLASLAMSLYCATWVARVPFNYNVLAMQSPDSDAVRVEKFLQQTGYSTLFAVTTAPDLPAAGRLAERLGALPEVASVESLATLLPSHLDEKRPLVQEICRIATGLSVPPPIPTMDAGRLLALHGEFQQALPEWERALASCAPSSTRSEVQKLLVRLRELLDPGQPGPIDAGLSSYAQAIREDLGQQLRFLQRQQPQRPDFLAGLPEELRGRNVSPQGRIGLRIFPREDCWEREPLGRFVTAVRRVDPGVTGAPLLIYYYLEELRQAYSQAGRNALLVIAVILLAHFRSLRLAALALFPKLLGVLWMVGWMGFAGVEFNAANFLALPITLGIGLIFGVHVLIECRANQPLFSGPTGPAILLSGATTTIGFSSFLMASHRGVSSFGFVMAAGVGANLVTSLLTLPALMRLLRGAKA